MGIGQDLAAGLQRNASWLLKPLEHVPWIAEQLNRIAIDVSVGCTTPRPLPYTLWTGRPFDPDDAAPPAQAPVDYVSWTGLSDRRFTGRHLPPAPPGPPLPDLERILALYKRKAFRPSTNTTALLCFFAQWFTDSFLRTHPTDRRLNTSNHEIDLCQIYGLDAPTARLLRTLAGGRLRTSPDGLFPDRLYGDDDRPVPQYADMPYMLHRKTADKSLEDVVLGSLDVPDDEKARRRARLYATGLERGNSTILYTAISTVFIREHNRLCDVLRKANPAWADDDDRLFETARNINIAMMLKLVINEYINHLARAPIKLIFDGGFAETRNWYRTNRIAIEFDLLYRWHSLAPDTLEAAGRTLPHTEYRFNNAVLEEIGVEAVIAAASRQPAGRLGLGNTPDFLWTAEQAAHSFARNQRLQPFVSYQKCFGNEPVRSFDELATDANLAAELKDLYGDVGRVEFVVGLFAQHHDDSAVLPKTLQTMVAVDAFSQILTNPLVSRNVYGEAAFGKAGLEIIKDTSSFEELVRRNAAPGTQGLVSATFDLSPAAAG